MHDPNTYPDPEVPRFEKEVQQKMEALEFSPSEAVWANVAQSLGGEKKRRRIPIFWLFFLPAFLLMGAAGIYFIGGHSGRTSTVAAEINSSASTGAAGNGQGSNQLPKDNQEPNETSSNGQQHSKQRTDDLQPNSKQRTDDLQPNSRQAKIDKLSNDPQPSNQQAANHRPSVSQSETISRATVAQSATIHTGSLHPAPGQPENNTTEATAGVRTRPARATHTNEKSAITGREATSPTEEATNGSPVPARTAVSDKAILSKPVAGAGEETTASKVARINLNLVSCKNAPKITAAPLATKNLTLIKTQLRPKRPWEAGFAGGIGVSSLNQTFLKRSTIASYDNRNYTTAITGQPQTYISKIQTDLAFWAGIFMQKPISNRLSISAGLNLRYYSTRIYTGDKVDLTGQYLSPPPANYYASALSAITAAAAPSPSYPYYAAGDNKAYINRYYFLEIPGSIQWQITHNRQMPMFWEGGFSLSYLMGSNALYYNDQAGVYYKDGDVTNKFQFNLSTALLVGIPFKEVNLQVGPQVQYGLTRLLNAQGAGQHLFYAGLKIAVIPGKAHKAGRRSFKGE